MPPKQIAVLDTMNHRVAVRVGDLVEDVLSHGHIYHVTKIIDEHYLEIDCESTNKERHVLDVYAANANR